MIFPDNGQNGENTLKGSGKLLGDAKDHPCRNTWNVAQLVSEE
jgi:hypothetical protein